MTGGGQINAASFGNGDGGDINITADSISVDGSGDIILLDNITSPSRISSSIQPDRNNTINDNVGGGEAGDINISTSSLAITNGAEVLATSSGGGDGGSIEIVAREEIVIDGGVEQERTELGNDRGSFFDTFNGGNSGSIEINTPTLKITNNGVVSSDTFNDENSGSIEINTQRLTVTNESLISASTFNRGNAGNLLIDADSVTVKNSQITADVSSDGTGTGGNLTINTENLDITSGGQISASTLGAGDAGNLTINAADSLKIIGAEDRFVSGIFLVGWNEEGRGGELNIATEDLRIASGGTINVGNFPNSLSSSASPGTGEPGNLNIQADSIALDNGRIDATTQSSIGNGANINIASEDIILDNNSSISARAFGEANGGNLTIDTQFIIAFPSIGEGNDLVADADRGTGGNITLNVDQLFGLQPGKAVNAERFLSNNTNDIDVSGNIDGNLSINASNVDPLRGSTELPRNVVQSQETSQQVCRASRETGAANGLNITGKGGVVPDPGLPLSSLNVTNNGETDATSAIPAPIETSQGKIQPARGIKVSKTGAITLTAYRTNNAGDRLPEIKPNCGG